MLALLGTRAEPASVKLVDRRALEPGERGLVQLIFAVPVIAAGGQPLLVRSGSPETTIGGGIVRSVFAPGLARGDAAWHERLRSLDGAAPTERLETAAWVLGERSWEPATAHQEAGTWSAPTPGVDFASGRIDPARLASLAERVFSRVESLSGGGAVERSRVVSATSSREEADVLAALDHLVAHDRLLDTAAGVVLPGGEDRISAEDRAALDEIRRLYETWAAAPLPADELATTLRVRTAEARRLVRLATERGVLAHASGPFFLAASVAAGIEGRVRALLAERGSIRVGDVRELLGVSRKHAVPICEYLDRVQVTRRVGDERVRFDEPETAGGIRRA